MRWWSLWDPVVRPGPRYESSRRRVRIVAVADGLSDLSVFVVDLQLGFLIPGNLAGVVDSVLLSDEAFDGVLGAAMLDIPAADRIWNNVMSLKSFGRHGFSLPKHECLLHYSGNNKYQKSLSRHFHRTCEKSVAKKLIFSRSIRS